MTHNRKKCIPDFSAIATMTWENSKFGEICELSIARVQCRSRPHSKECQSKNEFLSLGNLDLSSVSFLQVSLIRPFRAFDFLSQND